MRKNQRVRAALRREVVDRPPYSFWTHLPGIDLDPQRLADETAAFAARYDLDVIKAMPNGLYCVEDWGRALRLQPDRSGRRGEGPGACRDDACGLGRARPPRRHERRVQQATYSPCDENTCRALGEPYDRRVLEAAEAAGAWFDAVHFHGENILFDVLKTYNATALNWHIGETARSVSEYRAGGGARPILGGLQRGCITQRDSRGTYADIDRAISESCGGLLLAPGCVIRHPVDDATLRSTADDIKAIAERSRG